MPPFHREKRRISAWLNRHDMILADVGVDSPATVAELTDPAIIQSLIEDIEEDNARRRYER